MSYAPGKRRKEGGVPMLEVVQEPDPPAAEEIVQEGEGGQDGACSESTDTATAEFEEIRLVVQDECASKSARERVRRALHEQRMRELLRCDSGIDEFHKFSLACPAHLVCLVMCCWLCVALSIMAIVLISEDSKVEALRARIHMLEHSVFRHGNSTLH